MEHRRRLDEFDIDLENNRSYATRRYRDVITVVTENLNEADRSLVLEPRSWQDILTEIRNKIAEPNSSPSLRRLMTSIQPLPRSVAKLNGAFLSAVSPQDVQFDFTWGMIYLNLKLSYSSMDMLKKITEWLGNLRRIIELLNRCLDGCDDPNETRLAIVEIYDHLLTMLGETLSYLRNAQTDVEATKAWPKVNTQLQQHFAGMDATIRHLNMMVSYSKTNLNHAVKNLSVRYDPVPVSEEHAHFPCVKLPFLRNENFFGRETEMQRIVNHLSPKGDVSELRTYTVYGGRAVGKSEIALQYAYENPSDFDAIFWIQCETSISLRQSFTDIAVALKLEGTDSNGHHQENLLAVQKWLKLTSKKWLLIFDNAERESLLASYWPVRAEGAVLITSRKHYNFMKDGQRKGETIRPLNEEQSFNFLMFLLGEKWQKMHKEGTLNKSEIDAAKRLLKQTGGLMLAIQHAALSVNNPDIGGTTIAGLLDVVDDNAENLPEQRRNGRSEMAPILDTMWNQTFSTLTQNARDLLSVLAMLSPDSMLIDLFLSKPQGHLRDKLSFIHRQSVKYRGGQVGSLSNEPYSPSLEAALTELLERRLIRRDSRVISVNRVVQEAMNYYNIEDLQASFDSATALVYEAFPKAWTGDILHKQWPICQAYITHGVHICMLYNDYASESSQTRVEPTDSFTALMANCAWYLYEIGDYEACLKLVKTASLACKDNTSVRFANFRSTAGACYFDMNNLRDCRQNYEVALAIEQGAVDHDNVKVSYMLHNMGNLETACGRFEDAKEYFTKAIQIRTEQGHHAEGQLALTHLCMGRLYYLWEQYNEARSHLLTAKIVFVRISGADAYLLTFVNYLYGNIEFALENWKNAKHCYTDALRIALIETPIHFITSAIYYKLGCVEHAMNNHDTARTHLEKALAIAEFRSPSRDDGTIARLLFKIAKVLENDSSNLHAAQDLRARAVVAKLTLTGMGDGHILQIIDEDGNVDSDDTDDAFDALVPIFFR